LPSLVASLSSSPSSRCGLSSLDLGLCRAVRKPERVVGEQAADAGDLAGEVVVVVLS